MTVQCCFSTYPTYIYVYTIIIIIIIVIIIVNIIVIITNIYDHSCKMNFGTYGEQLPYSVILRKITLLTLSMGACIPRLSLHMSCSLTVNIDPARFNASNDFRIHSLKAVA